MPRTVGMTKQVIEARKNTPEVLRENWIKAKVTEVVGSGQGKARDAAWQIARVNARARFEKEYDANQAAKAAGYKTVVRHVGDVQARAYIQIEPYRKAYSVRTFIMNGQRYIDAHNTYEDASVALADYPTHNYPDGARVTYLRPARRPAGFGAKAPRITVIRDRKVDLA